MLSGWLADRRCGSRQGPSQLVAARGFVRRHFGQRHISPAETAAVTIAPFCSVSAAAKGSAQQTDLSTIGLDLRPERNPVGSKAITQQRDILDIWDTLDGAGRQIAQEGLTWSRARTFYREHGSSAPSTPTTAASFRRSSTSPRPAPSRCSTSGSPASGLS
ncbi:hypothetical protein [Streptomyces brevispora]|uniref:hypothetical protein n=1 Tax=Streptomyces brevispora TaxID=887462 RepID=UPI001ABF22B2|nr:hypothetical protein [Streptomyces brevispora]